MQRLLRGKPDGGRDSAPVRAAIRLFVLGHECVYTYWRCRTCAHYSVESCWDTWDGSDPTTLLGPLSPEVGDRCMALIAACPNPMDEGCGCDSHRALYFGTPQPAEGTGAKAPAPL